MEKEVKNIIETPETLTNIVKGNTANFSFYNDDKLFYVILSAEYRYEFPIDLTDKDDIGDAKFEASYNAIMLMRYIRKAIANQTIRWDKI
jgi:hypothetical protein